MIGLLALVAATLAATPVPAKPAPAKPTPAKPTEAAWPCPVATCAWAPDGRYLPLDPRQYTSVTADTPLTIPVPAGARVVGVVILPKKAPEGLVGRAVWEGADERVDLLAGRQVWSPIGAGDWPNVLAVPLGTGTTEAGAAVRVGATLVALPVPAGATALRIAPEKRAPLTVLASATWTDPPFPFTADRVVPDATWAPFELTVDETLAIPRPAALGPLAPIAGFVRRDGERLHDDAGPVHFYGTNLSFNWQLPTPADSERLAKGYAAIGFNLVRVTVFPVSRSNLYEGREVRTPTADEWDRFDALIDAFARHGIRVQFPLVEFDAQWADKGLAAQIDRAGVTHLYPYVDDAARAHQKARLREMLTHVNRRRGVSLAQDPAVAIVEVSNESGILRGFIAGSYDQLTTEWRGRVRAKWNTWLRERYRDDATLAAAWAGGASPGLQPGESLAAGTVEVGPNTPSRWGLWPEQRRRDLVVFHEGLDADYFSDMQAFLRDELGVQALIVGTQYMGMPTASRTQSTNALGDVHYQYDHPGGSPPEQGRAPLTRLPVDGGFRVLLSHAVYGQPLHVGEYNYGWPSPYEYEGPVFFATLAARQGWAGMNWFAWRHGPWTPEGPGRIEGQMDVAENPVKVGQMPVAAAIVRGGLLAPADGLCVTPLPDAGPESTRFPMPAPEAGDGEGQSLVDCRWRVVYDAAPPPATPPQPGPVRWDDEQTFVVDAPGVAAVLTDGDRRRTSVFTAGGAPGAVSVVGLDAVPLAEARRWLLVVASRALNSGHRELGGHTITSYGEAPVRLAPWKGQLVLNGVRSRPPKITRLGPSGAPAGSVPVAWDRAGWRVELGDAPPSTWYVVEWPAG